jgi:hypothetical protein
MARIFLAEVLVTTASGSGVDVAVYDVPSGKSFTLKVLGMGGDATTWSTTEAVLGYVYPEIAGVDKRGLEVRVMQGDVTGISIQYLIVPIPGGVTFSGGESIQVECDPATTTSTRWRGIIIGDET